MWRRRMWLCSTLHLLAACFEACDLGMHGAARGIDLWPFHPLAQEHSVGHSGTRDSCARCVGSDVHSPLPSLNPHRLP